MKSLNLGSGDKILQDCTNLDIVSGDGIDVVHDLEKTPYPFQDNEFDEVYANHVLEHIGNIDGLFSELQRICKDKAVVKIVVPYFCSPAYNIDPSHRRKFNLQTCEAYTPDSNYPYKLNFRILRRRLMFLSNRGFMKSRSRVLDFLINLSPRLYERVFCYSLPCSELHVEMMVHKR